jgi:cephalosporin hydroxylase
VGAYRPALSPETGFAWVAVALFIAEALRQNGSGRHIVIDCPSARATTDSTAARRGSRPAQYVTFHEEPSAFPCPGWRAKVSDRLRLRRRPPPLDYVVTERLLLARLLRVGGILVLDDTNLPASAARATSSRNRLTSRS